MFILDSILREAIGIAASIDQYNGREIPSFGNYWNANINSVHNELLQLVRKLKHLELYREWKEQWLSI